MRAAFHFSPLSKHLHSSFRSFVVSIEIYSECFFEVNLGLECLCEVVACGTM